MLVLLGIVAAIAAIAGLAKMGDQTERGIGFVALMFAVGFVGWIVIRLSFYRTACDEYDKALRRYRPAYDAWNKRIMCLRCGHVYTP
jgi:hypothetical protein